EAPYSLRESVEFSARLERIPALATEDPRSSCMAHVELQYFGSLVRAKKDDGYFELVDELLEPIQHHLATATLSRAQVLHLIEHENAQVMSHCQMADFRSIVPIATTTPVRRYA